MISHLSCGWADSPDRHPMSFHAFGLGMVRVLSPIQTGLILLSCGMVSPMGVSEAAKRGKELSLGQLWLPLVAEFFYLKGSICKTPIPKISGHINSSKSTKSAQMQNAFRAFKRNFKRNQAPFTRVLFSRLNLCGRDLSSNPDAVSEDRGELCPDF